MVKEAIFANPSLQQTVLTLKILRAQLQQTKAERLPEVSFDGYAEKSEEDDNNYGGALTISWEVDLWRKLADNESAAMMDEAEQTAVLQAARDALTAEVMQEWLGLTHDQHAINRHRRSSPGKSGKNRAIHPATIS